MSTTGGGGQETKRAVGETVSAPSSSHQPVIGEPTSEALSTPSSTPPSSLEPGSRTQQSHQRERITSTAQKSDSSSIPHHATSSSSTQSEHQTQASQPQHQQQTGTASRDEVSERPRQVIAVSASKGPAAFFNLARKFLVTDEKCDLSALEGAIVSAVDAAHLLERSKLATIVRVETSYVSVEPKRKKAPEVEQQPQAATAAQQHPTRPPQHSGTQQTLLPQQQHRSQGPQRGRGTTRELRRARIVITVQRTEGYKRWLEENPLQAMIAGDADDEELEAGEPVGGSSRGPKAK